MRLFRAEGRVAPKPTPRIIERRLELGAHEVMARLRLDPRCRRIAVRVDPIDGLVLISAPPRAGIERAFAFALSQEAWLAARLKRVVAATPFAPGASLEIGGDQVVIDHRPAARGGAWIEGDRLVVTGQVDHLARRVEDFLKAEARKRLGARTAHHAETLGLARPKIQVRDGTSRWGSCSPTGTLAFSWRLILAPPAILDYVAAHEVCHLRHMDHSDRFWRLLESLIGDCQRPRAWLRANGARLHRIGRDP